MGPIDYTQDLANPMQQALQGYAIGQALNQQRVAREQAAVQAQAEQARQAEISRVLGNPQATAEERARIVTMLPPQVSAQLQTVWKQASEDQANAMLGFDTQVFAALDNGRADLAVQLYEDRAKALEASGRGEEAKRFRQQAAMAKDNPALARNLTAMRIDASGDRGAKVWESYAKRGGEDRAQAQAPAALRQANATAAEKEADATIKGEQAKTAAAEGRLRLEQQAANLGLTRAQTNQAIALTRKYNEEVQAAAVAAKTGDPAKRFDFETKLRGEFVKETAGARDTVDAYRRLAASQPSAVGDISLIFSFMRMLDPASVVREGEFATAANAQGVPERVINLYNRVLSGERLTEQQRKSFMSQAKDLSAVAERRVQDAEARLQPVIEAYSLDRRNVFGVAAPAAPGQPAAPAPAPAPATGGTARTASAVAIPARVRSDADYAAVPKGATYIAPDGSTRVKR